MLEPLVLRGNVRDTCLWIIVNRILVTDDNFLNFSKSSRPIPWQKESCCRRKAGAATEARDKNRPLFKGKHYLHENPKKVTALAAPILRDGSILKAHYEKVLQQRLSITAGTEIAGEQSLLESAQTEKHRQKTGDWNSKIWPKSKILGARHNMFARTKEHEGSSSWDTNSKSLS